MISPSLLCHKRPQISLLICIFWVLVPLLLCPCGGAFESSSALSPGVGKLFRLQHKFGPLKTPPNGSLNSSDLSGLDRLVHRRSHDRLRHQRFLLSAEEYPLFGDLLQTGLYYTEIQIGTPPSKYYVQVDTGSDLAWLNCASCSTCPTTSDLNVALTLYNPQSSSTSAIVNCGDSFCSSVQCTSGPCAYQLQYGDGSSSEGYYVQDSLLLDLVNQSAKATSATVTFGCGTSQGGNLQTKDQALDGIMGFGQSSISIISQLVAQKQAPGMFAHCLDEQGNGGGILVIGQVQETGIVYTPIVPNQSHYNVNLKSMTVNSASIPIDAAASTSTIIDSGTTLAYFVEDTYQLLLASIISGLPQDTQGFNWQGLTCILLSSSNVDAVFPSVTLSFDGTGADMVVKPHDYMIQVQTNDISGWCIGFQNMSQDSPYFAILGDLLLQDRLVVYDLDQQRIGWVDYNCSSSVTVVESSGELEHVASPTSPPSADTSIINSANPQQSKLLHAILWPFILIFVYYLS